MLMAGVAGRAPASGDSRSGHSWPWPHTAAVGAQQAGGAWAGGRHLPLDRPLAAGRLLPGGSRSPVAQDNAMDRVKDNQGLCLQAGDLLPARPGLLLLACPGCLSRAGHNWPWAYSQDTLSQTDCTVLCPDQ